MSTPEENKEKEKEKSKEPLRVEVSADSEQMKVILQELQEEKERAKKAEEEKKAAEEAKKAAEEALEKTKIESDDYKGKLELVAAKEFEKKRNEVLAEAKKVIKDENRMKEIEAGLTDPEKLKATEFMIKTLDETLKKGAEEARIAEEEKKKVEAERIKAEEEAKKKAPSGSVPLNSAQTGQTHEGDEGYDSYVAMIQDLRRKVRTGTPEESAEADAILNELFKRWIQQVKVKYDGMKNLGYEEDKQKTVREITKKGGAA
jgi:hypothetical protein